MSAGGQNYPVTFELKADDRASEAMRALIAVMREGSNASSDSIQRFKALREDVSLQTRAFNTLRLEWRASNEQLYAFGRVASAVGSIGNQLLSTFNSLMLAQIGYAQTQQAVSQATANVAVAQQIYNEMVATYGPTSQQAIDALHNLINAQNALTNTQAQAARESMQLNLLYAGLALSIGSLIAQAITAAGAFSAFMASIGGASGILGGIASALGDATAVLERFGGGLRGAGGALLAFGVITSAFSYDWSGWWARVSHDSYVWQQGWAARLNAAGKALGDFANWVVGGLKPAIDAFNETIKAVQGLVDWLGKLGDFDISSLLPTINLNFAGGLDLSGIFANLPHLAEGGIVTGRTLAVIGEAGTEAVVPLSGAGGAASPGLGGGPITVNFTVQGSVITERQLADMIDKHLYTTMIRLRQ